MASTTTTGFEGRVAIITGGAQGIGFGVAVCVDCGPRARSGLPPPPAAPAPRARLVRGDPRAPHRRGRRQCASLRLTPASPPPPLAAAAAAAAQQARVAGRDGRAL